MKQWGGMHSNIQCTLFSKNKLESIKSIDKNENSPQVSTNVTVELLVEKMMSSIMNQVYEKIRVISENSLPRVSNQSFATDKVIGNHGGHPHGKQWEQLRMGRDPLRFIKTPGFHFVVGKIHPIKMKRHMSSGYLM